MVAALYRRYRPESFSEMIGQSQVTEPLMTALRNGRVGHAYLFSGPRGCGKTTSARILARCLNCAEGPTDTPCNVCPSCIELSRDGGGSLDVVEIDAASHGGVDDARDLRERAVFAPARDRFKIFIIDEAHMVTSAGFNALLKIVEEPPPHVKFVFATTEPEKVIGTIRSRTHHYPFRLIAPGTLIDYVQSMCEAEGVQVEPGVLPLVVRAGGGSVRDTLSILDQLIAGSEGTFVTAERAAGLLGFTGTELLDEVVNAFGAHDAAAAFRATDRVVQTGQDPRRFVEDLLERLRDLIVVSATTVEGAAAVFRGVPQDQLTRMFEQAQSFGSGELSRIADVTSETLDRMVGATAPRLQLELMIARALVALDELRGAAGMPASQPAAAQVSAPGAGRQMPAQAQTPAQPSTFGKTQTPMQAPMREQAPPQPPVPTPAQPPAPTPAPAQPLAPTPAAAPNAAQTAASVRDFLRGDSAGSQQPAPEVQSQAPSATPPRQPQPAHDPSRPHPNEGVAGFGRPISDILSPAQIASIGAEPTKPAPAQAQPTTPAGATSAVQASGAPQQPQAEQASQAPQAPTAPHQGTTAQQQGNAPGEPSEAPVAGQQANSGRQQSAAPASPAAASNTSVGTGTDAAENDSTDSGLAEDAAGGFTDLLEVWPDLLEEILEQDRAAWNAVKAVQPLSLEGDVLTVGVASRSDLDAFKATGSGPLREAILSAVGITVRYMPRPVQQGSAPASPPQASETADPNAEEPHRGPQQSTHAPVVQAPGAQTPTAQAPTQGTAVGASNSFSDDPMARAAARLSALGPALAAPAWADLPPKAPEAPATATALAPTPTLIPAQETTRQDSPETAATSTPAEPSVVPSTPAGHSGEAKPLAGGAAADSDPYANDPYAGEPSDEYDDQYDQGAASGFAPNAAAGPAPQPVTPETAEPAAPTPVAPTPAPQTPVQQQPASQRASAPAFTRYGESVVRETLGARFIEELPLGPSNQQN